MLKVTLNCADRDMKSRLADQLEACLDALKFEYTLSRTVREVAPYSAIIELSGPAGCGKTRTSIATAEACRAWGWSVVRMVSSKRGLGMLSRHIGANAQLVIINEVEVC